MMFFKTKLIQVTKPLLVFFQMFLLINTFAQNPGYRWAFKAGGASTDRGQSMVMDTIGNSYITGYFRNTVDFDPGLNTLNLTSFGGDDIFIAKYDSLGELMWAYNMGGTSADWGLSIGIDSSFRNIYVTGIFTGTVNFETGGGISNLIANGDNDVFLAKYSVDGVYQGAFSIGGSSAGNSVTSYSLKLDKKSNIYITGSFKGTIDFRPGGGTANLVSSGSYDAFVAKYDSTGTYKWAFKLGGTSDDLGYALAVDLNGNVYVTGTFAGTVDFDPNLFNTINLSSSNLADRDIYMAKYDSLGKYKWAFQLGGTKNDEGTSLVVDKTGDNVYLAGNFSDSADFDPGAGITKLYTGGGDLSDVFVAKYATSNGAFQWAFNIGGNQIDETYCIAVDKDDDLYVTGNYRSIVDFDPSNDFFNLTSVGQSDVFVAKYSSSGIFKWVNQIGGISSDVIKNIAIRKPDDYTTLGYFNGTADFDPGLDIVNITSSGSSDIFLARYAPLLPKVDFSVNITSVCAQDSVNFFDLSLNTPTSWTWYFTGGAPSSATNQNPLVTYSTPGTYDVKLVARNVNGSDSLIKSSYITVNALPTISVSGPMSVCQGETTIITADGGDFYSWSPSSFLSSTTGTLITAIPTTSITYSVAGTSGLGCINYNSVSLFIPAFTADAGLGQSLCDDGISTVTMTYQGVGATSYSWNPEEGLISASNNPSVTAQPTTSTTYTLAVTNDIGCNLYDTVRIDVTNVLVTIVNPNLGAICIGGEGIVLSATGGTNYSWAPSAGLSATSGASITANPGSNITYTVIAASGACPSTPDMVDIVVNTLPTINVSSLPTVACSGKEVVLTASGGLNYTWLPHTYLNATAGETISAIPLLSETFTVVATDINNCSNTNDVFVLVNPLPLISIAGDNSLCYGSSTILSADGALNYFWEPAIGISSTDVAEVIINPTASITYSVMGIDENGCENMSQSSVSVKMLPVITSSTDLTICGGGSTSLSAAGAVDYIWSPAETLNASNGTNVIATPTTNTLYMVMGTDTNGCTDFATTTITLTPAILKNEIASLCKGDSASLFVSGAKDYVWSPSIGLNHTTGAIVKASPENNIVYTVTAVDSDGCINSTNIILAVHELPTVIVSDDVSICNGQSTILSARGAEFYSWSPAIGLDANTGEVIIANPSSSQSYVVTGIDTNLCSNEGTVRITIVELPKVSVSADLTISKGQFATLTANETGIYTWYPMEETGSSIMVNPESTTTYTIVAADSSGLCSTFEYVSVFVDISCDNIFMPSAFSPNNDQRNDVLMVRGGQCLNSFKMMIFNRWGNVVFNSENINQGWDGKLYGEEMISGLFYYVITGTKTNNEILNLKGSVQLVR